MTQTQQGLKHASFRAISGTADTYNGDAMAAMGIELDAASLDTPETFNGRLLAWLQLRTGLTSDNLPGLMQAFAEQHGAYNWSSLGMFLPQAFLDDLTIRLEFQAPMWITGAAGAGMPGMDFDGTADRLIGAAGNYYANGCSLAVAFQPDVVDSDRSLFGAAADTNTRVNLQIRATGTLRWASATSGGNTSAISGTVAAATRYIAVATLAASGASAALRINGVAQIGTDPPLNSSTTTTSIGSNSGGAAFFDGRIGAVLAEAGRVWDAAEIAQVEAYLAARYGVTL